MVETLPTEALTQRAAPLVSQLNGALPDVAHLRQLTEHDGLDLATVVFYQAILASPVHGPFIRQLDALPISPDTTPLAAKVLVVPALLYAERPEFGGDGKMLMQIARACGFAVELIPIQSKGSMQVNADLIWAALEREPCRNLWLLSLSKGGGEVRLALQSHTHHPALHKVRGWLNICGLVHGSPLFDAYRFRMWTICLLLGADTRTVTELSASYPAWQAPFTPPAHMHVINITGVPLQAHIRQRNMLWRYTRLGRWGPNDGLALLPDLLVQPGLIYPVWGADHFFQTPRAAPLMHQLLIYLKNITHDHSTHQPIDRPA